MRLNQPRDASPGGDAAFQWLMLGSVIWSMRTISPTVSPGLLARVTDVAPLAAKDNTPVDLESCCDLENARRELDDLAHRAGIEGGLDGAGGVGRTVSIRRSVEGGARGRPSGNPPGNAGIPRGAAIDGNDVGGTPFRVGQSDDG